MTDITLKMIVFQAAFSFDAERLSINLSIRMDTNFNLFHSFFLSSH